MSGNYYKSGEFDVYCDRTGFKVKSGDTVKEWSGKRVRRISSEPRHPQDKLVTVRDNQTVHDPRPKVDPVFLSTNQITIDDL